MHDRRARDLPLNARLTVVEIDDPWSAPDKVERITVLRNVKTDPLAALYGRDQINESQFQAGRHWQRLHRRTTLGAIQSVNTEKEPVDGGSFPDVLTQSQHRAIRELEDVAEKLEIEQARLIELVLAPPPHCEIDDAWLKPRLPALRKALDRLAVEFGYASTPVRRRVPIRAWQQRA